ncbi:MAG: GNAT family N-acetyltransferase [Citrobacter freundii]|nr:MAG: GNAT family N-acetyltransferase [Citrobacter freundii]
MNITIRPIRQSDNAALAVIIRNALEEFGANHPGTVYYDASTDALYELFREPGSGYFVATKDEELLGGGGIFPTAGLPGDTCELVKMYLRPDARGTGLGKKLIETSLDFARNAGYKNVYLETMPELKPALKVYEKFGFKYLDGPLGDSGHTGCSLWMSREV